ncbi:MAG: radical SAM family heme chaperone HemW [Gammaproteobacteria bacterium]|nr:radical SAM family heme chaperone HemW [Gammaproteobacteria bacterium]
MNKKPISLYIHFPWCEVKCPYCDFNSYVLKHKKIDVDDYIDRLLLELDERKKYYPQKDIQSVFFGGGTPSLMSASQISKVLERVTELFNPIDSFEVTIEMNPESVTDKLVKKLKSTLVNRISMGVQSFNDEHLKVLGRIHNSDKALKSLDIICESFDNVNIDVMYGLPNQSTKAAMKDLETALQFPVKHFSWYQLTLEPQTAFYKNIPKGIPKEDLIIDIETVGRQLIKNYAFNHYEISAYAKNKKECLHNLNYWQFGDYMGIGAGAHSKYSKGNAQFRSWNHKKPETYMDHDFRGWEPIENHELSFEYFLNRMRLKSPISKKEFEQATNLDHSQIVTKMSLLKQKGLMNDVAAGWEMTKLGHNFYNDVVCSFIKEDKK